MSPRRARSRVMRSSSWPKPDLERKVVWLVTSHLRTGRGCASVAAAAPCVARASPPRAYARRRLNGGRHSRSTIGKTWRDQGALARRTSAARMPAAGMRISALPPSRKIEHDDVGRHRYASGVLRRACRRRSGAARARRHCAPSEDGAIGTYAETCAGFSGQPLDRRCAPDQRRGRIGRRRRRARRNRLDRIARIDGRVLDDRPRRRHRCGRRDGDDFAGGSGIGASGGSTGIAAAFATERSGMPSPFGASAADDRGRQLGFGHVCARRFGCRRRRRCGLGCCRRRRRDRGFERCIRNHVRRGRRRDARKRRGHVRVGRLCRRGERKTHQDRRRVLRRRVTFNWRNRSSGSYSAKSVGTNAASGRLEISALPPSATSLR